MGKKFIALVVLVLGATVTIHGQIIKDSPPLPIVTAAPTDHGLRFAAFGEVVEMRLEVFSSTGDRLFDTRFRRGNVLDWDARDQHGQPVAPSDSYLCVLTLKTLGGQLRQRHASVSWVSEKIAVNRITRNEISAGQSQAWESSRATQKLPALLEDTDSELLSLVPVQASPSTTVLTHNGQDGQVTSSSGALTLRTGDLFSGKDVERMRITEDGKVGIGTDKPKATLDVAGSVRVSESIKFADGTTISSTDGKLTVRDASGDPPTSNAAGTGSQNRVAKWIETGGAGTLGDSAIFETAGQVGVGTTTPEGTFHLQSPDTTVFKIVSSGTSTTGRAVFQMYRGTSATSNGWDFGYNTDLSTEGFIIRELTNGAATTRFSINKNTGNVGIGTSSPSTKLHVAGNGLFTGDLTVSGSISLPTNSITDAMVSNTLTASNLVTGSSVVSNAEVDDNLTINAGTINNTVIGGTTPAAGTFTTLAAGPVTFTGLRTEATGLSPNVIAGDSSNTVTAGATGATIGGGGISGFNNRVTDNYGTVAGGRNNRAGDDAGAANDRSYATIGGGDFNIASGFVSTVGGGSENNASGDRATISGGLTNIASGFTSTVPGGRSNTAQGDYSFAAGRRAQALNNGSFVWGDSTDANYSSTADNQFLIRAGGGVGINTNNPQATLHLEGSTGDANLFMRATSSLSGSGINFGVNASSLPSLIISQYNGTNFLPQLIIQADGTVSVNTLAASTSTHLCRNGTRIADCTSSLRYKERVAPFSAGLNLLNRLRPVTFKWKERDERDVGLIAEEVAQVEPLFATRNAAGEIQGVKYDQLSVVFINAFKEQQTQIEEQKEQLKRQQHELAVQKSQIEALRKLICRKQRRAAVCK